MVTSLNRLVRNFSGTATQEECQVGRLLKTCECIVVKSLNPIQSKPLSFLCPLFSLRDCETPHRSLIHFLSLYLFAHIFQTFTGKRHSLRFTISTLQTQSSTSEQGKLSNFAQNLTVLKKSRVRGRIEYGPYRLRIPRPGGARGIRPLAYGDQDERKAPR